MKNINSKAKEVLQFWFEELEPQQWFVKDDALDKKIHDKFATTLNQAAQAELFKWRKTPHGRLAEIIVLDQFSRNIFRDTEKSFAQDPLALALAQEAVALGADQALSKTERSFMYMPYMHSESSAIHEEALVLFQQLANPDTLDYEYKHKAIVDRFGRYPHRNEILGRVSNAEELTFLAEPGSGF